MKALLYYSLMMLVSAIVFAAIGMSVAWSMGLKGLALFLSACVGYFAGVAFLGWFVTRPEKRKAPRWADEKELYWKIVNGQS